MLRDCGSLRFPVGSQSKVGFGNFILFNYLSIYERFVTQPNWSTPLLLGIHNVFEWSFRSEIRLRYFLFEWNHFEGPICKFWKWSWENLSKYFVKKKYFVRILHTSSKLLWLLKQFKFQESKQPDDFSKIWNELQNPKKLLGNCPDTALEPPVENGSNLQRRRYVVFTSNYLVNKKNYWQFLL